MNDLTAALLRELLHYDPGTGLFTRKVGRYAGRTAGSATSKDDPRRRIKIGPKFHYTYRLAWLYVHGKWPDQQIDHINGDPTDDRLANLRDVSPATNVQNVRHARKDNATSGLLGVVRDVDEHGGVRYRAKIGVDGVRKHLGRFPTAEEASAAYLSAKRRLHAGSTL